jgi:hypothetical protein
MKALMGPSQRTPKEPQQKLQPSFNDKLNMLATKWKVS